MISLGFSKNLLRIGNWPALLLGVWLLNCESVYAGAAQWSTTNIQYLYSDRYANVGAGGEDSAASIITLEHANGWQYGDNFFFVDITNPDRTGDTGGAQFYGEISPRFSLSAITGKPIKYGILKDILVSTTAEIGSGFHNYLYGIAFDFDIFNMPVLQVNLYARNEIGPNTSTGNQLTLVWLKPFDLGPVSMSIEGFFDYAFGMDHSEDNIVSGPRLLFDAGKAWGSPGVLQVGIEYQLWRNKFGIDGMDEDAPQIMAKWVW